MRTSMLGGCALLLLAACPASSTTYHVAPDSSGDVPNIQAAIDAATGGDEIVLSDGTFTGDGNWDLDFGTKDLVLRSVSGYEATTIDCGFDGSNGVMHRGMTLSGGQSLATRVEGITFQHAWGDQDGGAMLCIGVSPVIRSVRVRENRVFRHGSAIFVQSGGPTIEGCVLESNFGSESGTAIYARQSWINVQRCMIELNTGGWGIVDLDGGTIVGCTFRGNRGLSDGGPGNDVHIVGGRASLLECRFLGRPVTAVALEPAAQVLIGSCSFEDNQSDTGACIFGSGAATVRNSTFRRSWAWIGGGAICFSGSLLLDHCVFEDNASQRGGTVYLSAGDLAVSHCTFARNQTGEGASAIVIGSGGPVGRVAIDHTILAFGAPYGSGSLSGAFECGGSPAVLEVSCADVFGNDGGDWTGCIAGLNGTNGSLSADPLFCDVATGDFSLQANSPCAPANTGECGLIGALGVSCGATALADRSWGSIKALYR
ncbi:MAG: right-handed parallel beta-helix repeat-containing protein [bacterium]